MPNTPKLRVPFAIRSGRAMTVEQNSTEEVEACVRAILRTPVGTHIDDPELGIPDPTFGGASFDMIEHQVHDSEPRATTVFTPEDIDELYDQEVEIQLREEG